MNTKILLTCFIAVLMLGTVMAGNPMPYDDSPTIPTEHNDTKEFGISEIIWTTTDDNADAYDYEFVDKFGGMSSATGSLSFTYDNNAYSVTITRTISTSTYSMYQYFNFTVNPIEYEGAKAPQLGIYANFTGAELSNRIIEAYNHTSEEWNTLDSNDNEPTHVWNVDTIYDLDYDNHFAEIAGTCILMIRLGLIKDSAENYASEIKCYYIANLFESKPDNVDVTQFYYYLTDNWVTFSVITAKGDCPFTIWDNGTVVGYSPNDGTYQVAKPTNTGLHVYDILVNNSHSGATYTGQTWNTSLLDDSWKWFQVKLTINPVIFSISLLTIQQNNDTVILSGWFLTPNTTLTWTLQEDGVPTRSGTLVLTASGEYNSLMWTKANPAVFGTFTLTITADGSSIVIHGYSIVMTKETFIGGSFFQEGDEYYQVIETESSEFLFVFALIIVSIMIPVAIGLGWGMKKTQKNNKSKDKSTDITRQRG